MKVLWERPIAKSSRLLGVGRRAVFLGGDEISALDLKTRNLSVGDAGARRQPAGRVLVRPDGLWQLTPRGIYEIDPDIGRRPADLPRRRPRAPRGRPVADRSTSCWPSPTGRSRPIRGAARRRRPATHEYSRGPRIGVLGRSSVDAWRWSSSAWSAPAHGQFFGRTVGAGGPANIEGFTVAGKGAVAARPTCWRSTSRSPPPPS